MSDEIPPSSPSSSGAFKTTHWSVVCAAQAGDLPEAVAALERLCRDYRPPLLGYVQRWGGYSHTDAEDLVHDYLLKFLEKNLLKCVHEGHGKFRYFLQCTLKHFLLDAKKWQEADKRGGGKTTVPLEDTDATISSPPSDAVFDRQWAETSFGHAYGRLEAEYKARGHQDRFEKLKSCLLGDNLQSYSELGKQLGLSEGGIKTVVLRFRQRFQQVLREEVEETMADPAHVEDEVRYLLQVLAVLPHEPVKSMAS